MKLSLKSLAASELTAWACGWIQPLELCNPDARIGACGLINVLYELATQARLELLNVAAVERPWRIANEALEIGASLRFAPALAQQLAQVEDRVPLARIELHGSLPVIDRLVEAAGLRGHDAERVVRLGDVRIDRKSFLER